MPFQVSRTRTLEILPRKGIKRMYNSDAFNLYLTCDRMKGVNK